MDEMDAKEKEFLTGLAETAMQNLRYAEEGLKAIAFRAEYGREPTTAELKQNFPYRKILREKLDVVI